jgi:hypothetical protein
MIPRTIAFRVSIFARDLSEAMQREPLEAGGADRQAQGHFGLLGFDRL